jgi:hypothetical protein
VQEEGEKNVQASVRLKLTIDAHAHRYFPGKYVGNRPVKLKKVDNPINPVEIGHRKARQLEKGLKKNRKKSY